MNKNELITAVVERTGQPRENAEASVNACMDAVTSALKDGEKVQILGFGTFEVKLRAARTGTKPGTKEPISIAACKVPSFKAGKALRDAVNQ